MTMQNEKRPADRPSHPMTPRRDNTVTWILGAVGLLTVLGVIIWSMSHNTNTATNRIDSNTGTATQSAPAPTPPAAPATTPSRP